jgi:DNA-binding phage protein
MELVAVGDYPVHVSPVKIQEATRTWATMISSSYGPSRHIRWKNTEADIDSTRLSKRTIEALEKLTADKRERAEAIISRTQTSEARARNAAHVAVLDREYRETGRIATTGEKASPEDVDHFRQFVKTLRDERLARGLSLEQVATRSMLDQEAVILLEAGEQANPPVATLMRYVRALDMRLALSLEPLTTSRPEE